MDERNRVRFYVEIFTASMERTIKRLWVLCVLLAVLLVGTNVAWVVYEAQFVDESVTQEIDTGDGSAFVAGIGDVNYAQGEADGETARP